MDILDRFNLKQTVSFQLQAGASSVIPNSFERCVVTSKVDFEDVANFGQDAQALHQLVYPTLPAGSCPPTADKYNWLIVRTATGSRIAIGEPWINLSTIEATQNSGLTIYCSSSPKNALNLARQVLIANGFVVSSIIPD